MSAARFCPRCGTATVPVVRGGIPRAACSSCAWIDWRNPKAGVAVILQDEAGRVLLVRRTAAPAGGWCIPCGNVEWEEDVRVAARREGLEETGFDVEIGSVYAVLSNAHDPDARSVGIWFRGRITGGSERPGGDVDRAGWFFPSEPPEPLAFPTDRLVLAALAAGRASCEPEGPS